MQARAAIVRVALRHCCCNSRHVALRHYCCSSRRVTLRRCCFSSRRITLRRCCFSSRHVALRRCCNKRRSNDATTCVAAALLRRRCFSSHRCNAAAGVVAALRRNCVAARSNGEEQRTMCLRQRQAALRCKATMAGDENFCFCFFFFFNQQFQRENESKTERKEAGFKTCFLALFVGKPLLGSICWQAPSRLCLLASSFLAMSTPFNGKSNTSTLQQQQHQQHPQH